MPSGRPRILVVDDDTVMRAVVQSILEKGGFEVLQAEDGMAGMRVLFREVVEAVLLDVEMPNLDGWGTLERIREVSEVPVMMLTSQDAELSKVRGLRGGADDYLVKPFGNQELLARVEALVRRGVRGAETAPAVDVSEDARLRVDHEQRLVWARGTELPLTPTEFALLAAFVRNPGQVIAADRLADLAWGNRFGGAEQVKLYVSRIRRKVIAATQEDPIETLRGFGYRYRPG